VPEAQKCLACGQPIYAPEWKHSPPDGWEVIVITDPDSGEVLGTLTQPLRSAGY
jgi:hypothetical protein